ncbi:hypothetical protein Pelo_2294 [Pelomyxa schiedti]|nr:hypothetical protein Pelo_2294 [Pelomyxa schiedti]
MQTKEEAVLKLDLTKQVGIALSLFSDNIAKLAMNLLGSGGKDTKNRLGVTSAEGSSSAKAANAHVSNTPKTAWNVLPSISSPGPHHAHGSGELYPYVLGKSILGNVSGSSRQSHQRSATARLGKPSLQSGRANPGLTDAHSSIATRSLLVCIGNAETYQPTSSHTAKYYKPTKATSDASDSNMGLSEYDSDNVNTLLEATGSGEPGLFGDNFIGGGLSMTGDQQAKSMSHSRSRSQSHSHSGAGSLPGKCRAGWGRGSGWGRGWG